MKRGIKTVKKCNFCGVSDNLCVDKLGRIYRICKKCKIEQSEKGRNTQRKKLSKKESVYIIRATNGKIINIDKKFFIENYKGKNVLLENLAEEYQTSVGVLRKYLSQYSIDEYNVCRYCGSISNLLYMEGRICNCCSDCWKSTYKNRKYYRVIKKKGTLNTTSGIGVKAQFLFLNFEKELNKRNIFYEELIYGFYDIKNRRRIKSEKTFKVKSNEAKRGYKIRFADCYLKIGDNEYIIEFDEFRHNEYKNYINDGIREYELRKNYPNIQILRVSENLLKIQGYFFIIHYLIEAVLEKQFILFRSIEDNYSHDCFVDEAFDTHFFGL